MGSASGHSGEKSSLSVRLIFPLAVLLLTTAFVLGGASRLNELNTLAIELVSLPLLVAALLRLINSGGFRSLGFPLAVLGAVVVVPLLQLVPLPPQVWTLLPGREPVAESLRLAGAAIGWAPASVTPEATLRSALWLIPPSAMMLGSLALTLSQRLRLVGLVVGLCVFSLIVGSVQATTGLLNLYPLEGGRIQPLGFFSNRNHHGALMAIALLFSAVLVNGIKGGLLGRREVRLAAYAALVILFAVAVLITRSRAAIVLGMFALAGGAAIVWGGGRRQEQRGRFFAILGGLLLVLGVLAQVAIAAVLQRFGQLSGEARFEFWPVILKAAVSLLPTGSGLGSFDTIYRAAEPIQLVGRTFTNHAHNEYLELLLEAGALFPLVLLAFSVWFVRSFMKAWGKPIMDHGLARASGLTVMLLMLHSSVDYPLRTLTLACIFALCCGMLANPVEEAPKLTEAGARGGKLRQRRRVKLGAKS